MTVHYEQLLARTKTTGPARSAGRQSKKPSGLTVLLPRKSKHRKILSVLGQVTLAGLAATILIFCLIIVLATAKDPQREQQLTLPAAEQIRFNRLLMKHGLIGHVSVIERHPDGTLWFERDGRMAQLK